MTYKRYTLGIVLQEPDRVEVRFGGQQVNLAKPLVSLPFVSIANPSVQLGH